MLHLVAQKADILGSYVIFAISNLIEVFEKFMIIIY